MRECCVYGIFCTVLLVGILRENLTVTGTVAMEGTRRKEPSVLRRIRSRGTRVHTRTLNIT